MIIAFLGVLDMIAGGVLMFGSSLTGSGYLLFLAILFFLKAIYSVLTALAGGFLFDVLGWLDLLSALFLLFLYWGFSFGGIFFWVGVLMLIKGIYSFVIAFIMN